MITINWMFIASFKVIDNLPSSMFCTLCLLKDHRAVTVKLLGMFFSKVAWIFCTNFLNRNLLKRRLFINIMQDLSNCKSELMPCTHAGTPD